MDNGDTGRHAPAVSGQTGIPRTRPAFTHAAPALRDSGYELSRAPAAHRNVARAHQAGSASATVLPDKFSRGRQGWRVRSPPTNRARQGARLKEPQAHVLSKHRGTPTHVVDPRS
jgi:hypothetical protein